RLHAVALADLNHRIDLWDLVLADQVSYRSCAHHDLVSGGAATAFALEQDLTDDRLQRAGNHRAHHFLIAGGEHVDDAIHRLGRRTRVEGSEHEVPGLRRREGQRDRLVVTHFADQDRIRVLTQGAFEGA